MHPLADVIAAIATPLGEGGLSIIRVSGDSAIEMIDRQFRGKHELISVPTHTAHVGYFLDKEGKPIDEVVVTIFRKPHSYTCQDLAEISCHGGLFVTRRLLEGVLDCGARMAEPGEFTKRAFLNGRIDLAQAEAVAAIIRSRSDWSLKTSLSQLQGGFSERILRLRDKLVGVCGLLELELDFAEEGLELTDRSQILKDADAICAELQEYIQSYRFGKLCRDGIRVAIVGRPNVGKSSILNMLLTEERAIVSELPGTTRDTIEESFLINGLLFTVTDTAGLRESRDVVELEGMSRAMKEVRASDVVLFVVDPGDQDSAADEILLGELLLKNPGQEIVIVENKIDLRGSQPANFQSPISDHTVVHISAKTGEGLTTLKEALAKAGFAEGERSDKSIMVTSARQYNSLLGSLNSLMGARRDIVERKSGEFIAVNLRESLDKLGEIVGVVTTEDILNQVFSMFCIGK